MVEQPRPGLGEERGLAARYHLATPAIAAKGRREHIYLGSVSPDHAPLVIDYDFL